MRADALSQSLDLGDQLVAAHSLEIVIKSGHGLCLRHFIAANGDATITWKSLGPAELLNGVLQRTLGVAVILPWLAFPQQVWSSAHGEALRIKPRLHLIPIERHGYRRGGPGARRQWRHRTRGEVVAQIVEKDAAGT